MATEKYKYFTSSTLEVVAGISELWLAMKDRSGIQHWLVCRRGTKQAKYINFAAQSSSA